jgi:hypothetical protein
MRSMKMRWLTIGCGRGPTRFISPRSMLTSCGNSSRRKRRSQAPTRVMRSRLSWTHSDFMDIGRVHRPKLQQLERLAVASGAILHEQNGPRESSLTMTAMIAKSGASTIRPAMARRR